MNERERERGGGGGEFMLLYDTWFEQGHCSVMYNFFANELSSHKLNGQSARRLQMVTCI